MTIDQARLILNTYSMPMNSAELALYRKALTVVSNHYFRRPGL